MPHPPGKSSFPPLPPGTSAAPEPDQWLEMLSRSDQSSAKMMAIEIWAIAKTIDALIPGFWGRFMANRQLALRQFLQQKQNRAVVAKAAPEEREKIP